MRTASRTCYEFEARISVVLLPSEVVKWFVPFMGKWSFEGDRVFDPALV